MERITLQRGANTAYFISYATAASVVETPEVMVEKKAVYKATKLYTQK